MAEQDTPWYVPVEEFVAPSPGEHPRLFFRKGDIPELRRRAETPEGKAIVAELKRTLGGGEAMPSHFRRGKGLRGRGVPLGTFTLWHGAGFGFLYQLTGEARYADLCRQSVELVFQGQMDRDEKYSWKGDQGGLRIGPALSAVAMAYDLCYDGWTEAFRLQVAKRLWEYETQDEKPMSFVQFASEIHYKPGSNHFGNYVGGAGLVLLALRGDQGVDATQLERLLNIAHQHTVLQLKDGFGDHGFFAESHGPAQTAANPIFVPYLQAQRIANGRDYRLPRPNARWITLRYVMEIVPQDGKVMYPARFASKGSVPSAYGTDNLLDKTSYAAITRGGWFSQGFGNLLERERQAMLWVYNAFIDSAYDSPYDIGYYPHRAIFALVNWPWDLEAVNPAEVLPKAVRDEYYGYYMFRNRWKDADDILVTAILNAQPGNGIIRMPSANQRRVYVWGLGMRETFGTLEPVDSRAGALEIHYRAFEDGSAELSGMAASTTAMAVDFSGTSGAEALLVMTGPGAPRTPWEKKGSNGASMKLVLAKNEGSTFAVLTLQKGKAPEVRVKGDTLEVGLQRIRFDKKRLLIERTKQ